jgi:hypothetical protein
MGALASVLTVIETLTKLAPTFVSTWNDLKPFAAQLYTQFKGEQPTDAELVDLEAQIDALATRLQIPLPPAQPGDPDFKKPI